MELFGFEEGGGVVMYGDYRDYSSQLMLPRSIVLAMLKTIPESPQILEDHTNQALVAQMKKSRATKAHIYVKGVEQETLLGQLAIRNMVTFDDKASKAIAEFSFGKVLVAFQDRPAVYMSTLGFHEEMRLPLNGSRLRSATVVRRNGAHYAFTTKDARRVTHSDFACMTMPGRAIARLPIPIVFVEEEEISTELWRKLVRSNALHTFFVKVDQVAAFTDVTLDTLFVR